MIAIFLLAIGAMLAFTFGVFIWNVTKRPDDEAQDDPNADPCELKIKLLKVKETLSTDSSNLTFCQRCNKHMARLYYNDKPTNEYQCLSCRKSITLIAR